MSKNDVVNGSAVGAEFGEGEGMSEWKESVLGEITEYINRGFAPKYVDIDGEIVINQKCIRDGRIDFSISRLTDKSKQITTEKILKIDDILVNSTGVGTAGRIARFNAEVKATVDSHVSIVRINKAKADPLFVFYSLRLREGDIEGFAEGSTGQIELGRERIKLIDILLPPLPEQKAIAQILSSLDDKIDLLHRQNKTLETIAETLFRQWFIEEAQDDWEDINIGRLGKVITGKTPSTQNQGLWGEAIDFITPTDFKNYGKYSEIADRGLSLEGKEIMKNFLIPANSILVTCIGSDMGKIVISRKECITNQQINSLIIHSKSIYLEYVYQYLKSLYPLLRSIALGGTTMPIINKTDFSSIEISLPPNEKLEKFNFVSSSFNAKIKYNLTQIRTLEKLRNTLLPKLMSGEVRVAL